MTVQPVVSRAELEALYARLFKDKDLDELARYFRNSGFVEKVTVGEQAAQGRVRGKRRDAGFNVRIHFSGTCSCKCPRAKKGACEHVGALLLDVIARLGEAASAGKNTAINSKEAAPEVYKFLLDLFPGIGPRRAREVARVFRTVPDLLQATPRQFRNLPEIGVWAAQVLHEHLERHKKMGRASSRGGEDSDKPRVHIEPDVDWLETIPRVETPPHLAGLEGSWLAGRTVLVQGTKAGAVFFRMDAPDDPRVRRVITHLRAEDRGAFRASRKHHVWASDMERFPRIIGRLEAMGAKRDHAHLADVPLDGLTMFMDAAGRRARFQFAMEGLEEVFPLALDIIKRAEGYEYEEHTGQHLVLPREFANLASDLGDLGALLIRRRLRPVREIAEWKPEEPEDYQPGTPTLRPAPDLTPFLKEDLPEGLRADVVLRPYQREGVAFIRATNYLAYLGDPPGLGKCVTGESVVQGVDGPVRMEDLWKRPHVVTERDDVGGEWAMLDEPIEVNAFDPVKGMHAVEVRRIYRQRVREDVVRIRLGDGSTLTSTGRHKYMTPDGCWTEAGLLAEADKVAVPAKTLHRATNDLPAEIAELMAWQLAEANEHHNNPSRTPVGIFHNSDERVLERVRELAEAVGVTLPPTRTGRTTRHILTSKLRHVFEPWGYSWGHLAAGKVFPEAVLRAPTDAQRAFVQAFFEAEGCVNTTHVELTTASPSLAYGLRDVLRNFGVWLRISETRKCATNGSGIYRTYFRCTFGGHSVARFAHEFRFLSDRKQAALEALAARPRHSNVEGVPIAAIANEAGDTGLPITRLGLTAEHRRGKGVLKSRARAISSMLRTQGRGYLADELDVISSESLHWCPVASVERVPFEGYVYDVEVPEAHNYVVNGILTHNTVQALTAALYLPGRILVVCPAGARNVWKKEIEQHTTESVFVFRPTSRQKSADEKFVVASYDALLSRRDAIMNTQYDLVILDEAHYVKNKDAERTKAVHEELRNIPRRVLLSGTPVMNRADEVRKQLEFIYPDEWGNEPWFRRRFVQPLQHGTPEVRMAALSRLREYFQGVMVRRGKMDVLKDLPPKHVVVERVRLPQAWRSEYNAEAGKLREHIRIHRDTAFGVDYETTRGHILTLRQLASNGKSEDAEAYVRKILSVPGEKVVVFAYYLQHLETLEKALAEYGPVVVHGGVVDKERERAVRTFQEDPNVRVFLGQITAAGTALTLTAARHAVFVDLDWNPANHEQAGDRIHRISQTREVFVHYLVASGTVEDDVVKLLQQKSTMTSALLDGDEASAGLLQQRRENRTIAKLALKVAMAEPVTSEDDGKAESPPEQ